VVVTHRDIVIESFNKFYINRGCSLLKNLLKNRRTHKYMRLLDIGCGNTRTFEKAARSRGMLWKGVDRSGSGEVTSMLMEDLNLEDNYAEIIVSCHSLEHSKNPLKALEEMYRVLKPGGYLFLATPPPNKHHILESDKDHYFVLTELQLTKLLQVAGFVGIDVYTQRFYQGKLIDNPNNFNIISVCTKEE
jgi:SAM-dependent methyltransferase